MYPDTVWCSWAQLGNKVIQTKCVSWHELSSSAVWLMIPHLKNGMTSPVCISLNIYQFSTIVSSEIDQVIFKLYYKLSEWYHCTAGPITMKRPMQYTCNTDQLPPLWEASYSITKLIAHFPGYCLTGLSRGYLSQAVSNSLIGRCEVNSKKKQLIQHFRV